MPTASVPLAWSPGSVVSPKRQDHERRGIQDQALYSPSCCIRLGTESSGTILVSTIRLLLICGASPISRATGNLSHALVDCHGLYAFGDTSDQISSTSKVE